MEEVDNLVPLPAAAERLGLHRATVNEMIHQGRIAAVRLGPHWYIRRSDLEAFAASYRRPPNTPYRPRRRDELAPATCKLQELLTDWGDATVAELAIAVDLHEGNIRKHLRLLEARGLAGRDEGGTWRPKQTGEERLLKGDAA
jgi:excisionase family DNA binding protein